MSPGGGAAMPTSTTLGTSGAGRGACGAAGVGVGAVRTAASPGAASPTRRWNSTNAICCRSLSSVTMKSLSVSPSITLPALSRTTTVLTTRRVLPRKTGGCSGAAPRWGCCACAPMATAPATAIVKSVFRIMALCSESEAKGGSQPSHVVRPVREAELIAVDRVVHADEGDAVEEVRRVDPPVEADPFAHPERPRDRSVHRKLARTSNRVARRVAPFAGAGNRKGRGVRVLTICGPVDRLARQVRPRRADDARAADRREVDGSDGQTAP